MVAPAGTVPDCLVLLVQDYSAAGDSAGTEQPLDANRIIAAG